MDFLKALMLYMSLMFATSVQNALPPGDAPEVTKVPEVVVAQQSAVTPASNKAQVVGSTVITPDPNATPTPTPVPTLTPNPKYGVLRFGDRGDNVKTMQKKLIELGYLTGTADGAFGYQTLNAVRAFQKANGLSADGDAGAVTLTQLYENPDAARNPNAPTPKPDEIPQPEADASPNPSAWAQMDGISMLLNGRALALITERDGAQVQGRMHVWLKDQQPYVSLDELSSAADGWSMDTDGEGGCTVHAAGYALCLLPGDGAQESYQDGYTVTVDGAPVDMGKTDAVCLNGRYLVSAAFLRETLHASVTWDLDEMTLVLQIPDKTVAQSVD